MNFIQILAAKADSVDPVKLNWIGKLLVKLFNAVGYVALAVILFTLIVKLITLPLDVYSRFSTKKNEFIMRRMKPQLDKLKKQYAGNPQLYQQKLSAVYKKEGYSMFGMCLPLIVSLIFFGVVFSAFRSYSKYAVAENYNHMVVAYNEVLEDSAYATLSDEELKEKAAQAAADAYYKEKADFIWVKNLWVADNPLDKAVPTAAKFESLTGIKVDATQYNAVTAKLNKESVNGYFILPILCMAFTFLSQWLMQKMQKSQTEMQTVEGQPNVGKWMNVIMPIMMGIFALSYSSAFTIYMIVSSIYATVSNLVINWIATKVYTKKMGEVKQEKVIINR
ncbi:MAG: YidC/Oxa1 family membrane protein insertase [Clostridiales bacterium]|nr:YidC/Oxa1 family membrane protein insertase [Clostridiales bacterium]